MKSNVRKQNKTKPSTFQKMWGSTILVSITAGGKSCWQVVIRKMVEIPPENNLFIY